MKKNYIQPRCRIVALGTEAHSLLAASDPVSDQFSDFNVIHSQQTPTKDIWGRYTGDSYSILDSDWGN